MLININENGFVFNDLPYQLIGLDCQLILVLSIDTLVKESMLNLHSRLFFLSISVDEKPYRIQ
jgi:hypothetical protein